MDRSSAPIRRAADRYGRPMPTNTEIVKAAVDALNDHDVSGIRSFWAPDGVERFPDAVCHGHEEIGRYFQAVFDAIPDLRVDPVAFAAGA